MESTVPNDLAELSRTDMSSAVSAVSVLGFDNPAFCFLVRRGGNPGSEKLVSEKETSELLSFVLC